jgi:thioredoxin
MESGGQVTCNSGCEELFNRFEPIMLQLEFYSEISNLKSSNHLQRSRIMSVVYHTSAENFPRDVLSSPVPVLVDFYADWCGPCRMLASTLDKLAVEFSGKARIVKVNVDKEPELATQYRVSSIPALMFIADGKVVSQSAGAASEATLRQALNQMTKAAA